MILPKEAIVAVADGQKLRLFRNKGVEPEIKLVEMPNPDLDTDNTGSGARHQSSAANPDGGRLEEDNFAASIAGYLNRQVLDSKTESVFLIADPRTLGEMRNHFHKSLEAALVGQLAKDLTGHSIEAIEGAVGKA